MEDFNIKVNHFKTYEDLTEYYYNQFIALAEHRECCDENFGNIVEQTITDRYNRDKAIFLKDEKIAMKQYYAEKRYKALMNKLQLKQLVREEKLKAKELYKKSGGKKTKTQR